jgi:UDP-N-acetylglucosamine--N-acetylmuramyl-(pentapeptide) pyrophosphoryl-undecaprenol N-acetylglucosamine transferase
LRRRDASREPALATILYGVSPIGFGHASRSVAIGLKLREMSLEPEFATGGPAVRFLQSYGFKVHDVVSEPNPSESEGEMKMATLWYLRYWLGYRSTSRRMADLVTRLSPSLVVGDEEFSSVSLAMQRGISHAMISDELQLGFARSAIARRVEARVSEWYADLQRSVCNLLVPSFGTDSGNIHYMTPVTREVTKPREAVRAEHGLPLESSVILLSSSGSGMKPFLLHKSLEAFRKVCKSSDMFATTGVGGPRIQAGNVRELGIVRDNQNLIASVDLVISTAGKSTIDESASSGTPIIAIPIKNHVEQERNAGELGLVFEDKDRLEELIPKLLGKRSLPAHYSGAQRTADYLASLLRAS